MTEAGSTPTSGGTLPSLALLLATASGVAGLAHLGALPAAFTVLGWSALGLGLGLPLLARWSPVEPSPMKLLVFAALLSPLLATAALAVLDRVLAPGLSVVTLLFGCAGLQLLLLSRPLGTGRPGWAAGLAWIAALGAALFGVVLLLDSGSVIRLQGDGNGWQASVAQHLVSRPVALGGAIEDPWLAGARLGGHPGLALVVAAAARLSGQAAEVAQAGLAVGALCLLPLVLYLLAAVGSGSGLRHALALGFGLVGWNALGGLWPIGPPPGGWGPGLAVATPQGATGEVLYGGATWVRLGPASVATTYALAALTAGAHGLRHGRRPWVGLTALMAGGTLVLSAPLGAATIATLALAAGLRPGSTRAGLVTLGALIGAALPGVLLWQTYGAQDTARLLAPELGMGTVLAALPLLVLAAWAWLPDPRPAPDAAATVRWIVALGALAPVVVALTWPAAGFEAAALIRLASFPLAVLAAEGLGRMSGRAAVLRVLGPVIALVLLGGGGHAAWHAFGVHRLLAETPGFQVVPSTGRSAFARPDARQELLERLAATDLPSRGAVVVLRPGDEGERFGPNGAIRSLVPLTTGCAIFVDETAGPSAQHDLHVERLERVTRWFMRPVPDRNLTAVLAGLDRPVVVLIDERDRKRTAPEEPRDGGPRGVDRLLVSQGAERLFEATGAALYLLPRRP